MEKSFLQKNWKKTFYKDLGKNFFYKNLAKVLKQKHKNNFLKTFFTQLFLKTNIFVTSKKVLYKHFLHKKEKKKKKSWPHCRRAEAAALGRLSLHNRSGQPRAGGSPRPRCRSPRLEEARMGPHTRRRFPREGAR
jgi:hypothetical protein